MTEFEEIVNGGKGEGLSFQDELLGVSLPNDEESKVVLTAIFRQMANGRMLQHADYVFEHSPGLSNVLIELFDVYSSVPENDFASMVRGSALTLEVLGQLETHRQQGANETTE